MKTKQALKKTTVRIILAALAVFSFGPTTPLQAGEDLLQQFKSLRATFKRDFNAIPQDESDTGITLSGLEDVDGPIRTEQRHLSRDMQMTRLYAEYAGRFRSLLARDTELAAYGERISQICSQLASLAKQSVDLDSQVLSIARALKAIGPHDTTGRWNALVNQKNALVAKQSALIDQFNALDGKNSANSDDIQNRLQKRQSVGRADGLANSESTTSGAFGSRTANPKLVPVEKGTIGPNTKPGAQVKAAALEAKKGDKSDFRKHFDEGGAQSDGSLVAAHTLSAGPLPIDLSHFSERAKKDPQIVASLNNLSKLESKRMQVDKELNQLTAQRNAAKDPGTMKDLTKKVDQENKVKQANLLEITNTTQEIEKRHRKIDY